MIKIWLRNRRLPLVLLSFAMLAVAAFVLVGQAVEGNAAEAVKVKGMKPGMPTAQRALQSPANLITNPDLSVPAGVAGTGAGAGVKMGAATAAKIGANFPDGWTGCQSNFPDDVKSTCLVRAAGDLDKRFSGYVGASQTNLTSGVAAAGERGGVTKPTGDATEGGKHREVTNLTSGKAARRSRGSAECDRHQGRD